MSTTQIYTQVAIRQLQQVHANTHPGALKRVRSDQAQAVNAEVLDESENTAEALFAALEEEDDDASINADQV